MYQYIPPSSEHKLSLFKKMILRELKRYSIASSLTSDYTSITTSFRQRQLGNSAGGLEQKTVLSKPTVRVGAGTVAATNVVLSMLKVSPWLSTAAGNTEHAGVKLYIDPQTTSPGTLNVVVRTNIDFKYAK